MKKILIIEDEKDTIKALSTALKMENERYEIHSGLDGESGLAKVREILPDIILLDILLPGMDGVEVCRLLKSDEMYKSIPIIMLTALKEKENIVKGLSAGANDYVGKPFNFPELFARVASHLKMKELYDAVKSEEEEKSVLLDVSKVLSTTMNPHETLYTIVTKIAEVIEVKRCSVIYVDPQCQKGYVMASHDSKKVKRLEIDLNKYPEIEMVIKTKKPVVVNDVYNDPILFSVRDVFSLIDIKSIMAFPVSFKDTLIGTLILRTCRRENPFTEREIRFCEVISHLAGAPLKNSYLFDLIHKEKEKEKEKRLSAEAHSKFSKEMLGIILENTPAPICVFDEEGNITDVNNSYLNVWASGRARGEVIGQNIINNTRREFSRDFFVRILNGEKQRYECCRVVSPEGEKQAHIFQGAPLFDSKRDLIGGIFTTSDITEIKRAKDMLKKDNEELESQAQAAKKNLHLTQFAIDRASVAAFLIDIDANFIYVNDMACAKLGYNREELLSMKVQDIDPIYKEKNWINVWEDLKQCGSMIFESTHKTKDGRIFPVEITANHMEFQGIEYNCAFAVDITERKRAKEEQKKIMRKLEKSNENIKNFLSTASHDLRGPLLNIEGFSKELINSYKEIKEIFEETYRHSPDDRLKAAKKILQDNIPESIYFINSATTRMDSLISHIINLDIIGRKKINPAQINTFELIKKRLDAIKLITEKKNIIIKVNNLPDVVTDEFALDKIFEYIISNAVVYTDIQRQGKIEITGKKIERETLFSVKDNGIGIPEEDHYKVFKLFRRVGKPETPGDGMGLPYAKAYIDRLGGDIWYESREGVETTFYFTILDKLVSSQKVEGYNKFPSTSPP